MQIMQIILFFTECGLPANTDLTKIRGNVYKVGANLVVNTNEGHVQTTCQVDGTWSIPLPSRQGEPRSRDLRTTDSPAVTTTTALSTMGRY